jgi:hypothetical protein
MSLSHRHDRIVLPKMAIPFPLPRDSQGSIMFKRLAAGQRIFSSEPAAPSIASAPSPMTTSDSISADLHHVGDEERKGYANGEQPPGFSAVGYMFRRLSLRR